MAPLPHRIRRLSLRVRATSQRQALALRQELRDQLDAALMAAMERAFDEAGARDEIIHIPRLHVHARISGKDALVEELVRCIEQELGRQLSASVASVGQTGTALQAGASGAERMGRAGVTGLASARTEALAGELTASRPDRVQMLLHYLETGSLPWPLAQVDPAVVVSELREAAGTDPSGVIDRLNGEPVSLPTRVAFWFRWLQLLPEARWPILARAAALPSSGQGARLAEIIGVLSREHAGTLSRYARLQLAAAAIARARRTGELADTDELASIVLHVLGGGGAGGPAGVERTVGSGARATSGSGSHGDAQDGGGSSRPAGSSANTPSGGDSPTWSPGDTARHASRAGDDGSEKALGAPASMRDVDSLNGGSASGPAGSGASAMSGSGPRGAVGHGSGARDGAGGNDRISPSDRRSAPAEERLSAASELAARLPEPAAAVLRAWLASPSGRPQMDVAESSAIEELSTSRASMARDGAGEPRPGQLPPPGQLFQSRPEPGLAPLPLGTREPRSRSTGAHSAPFGQRVHHAGLVLLHPFLSRFFEGTAVKAPGNPALASSVLPRAAALLHLLATGEEEVFELELDFIKVLLGLPIASPLPVSEGLLHASDREEVEALLSAVIGHWSVLKNTSVKGLRGTFLQRPGLLREEDQGFRLQVESAPFDMLLGQLPWGISTVKLPWMKRAIFTEWPAP